MRGFIQEGTHRELRRETALPGGAASMPPRGQVVCTPQRPGHFRRAGAVRESRLCGGRDGAKQVESGN